jgi:hypothetical protein
LRELSVIRQKAINVALQLDDTAAESRAIQKNQCLAVAKISQNPEQTLRKHPLKVKIDVIVPQHPAYMPGTAQPA